MMKAHELIERARGISADDLLSVIDEVEKLISDEMRGSGRLRLRGKLIYIPPTGEAAIVGDLHGDIESLKHILVDSEFVEKASRGEDARIIFLGDYGDRGIHSPEVYFVVLSLKAMFPDRVVLLQGNHEGPPDLLAHPHDLPYHLQLKFGGEWSRVYDALCNLFRRFYTAALVPGRFLMVHGGVPAGITGVDDLAYAYQRHPSESLLEEILWSDPRDGISGVLPSPRGAGRLFGEDVTSAALEALNVKFIVRGHEPAAEGYKFNHNGKVLTLFSRRGPPYYNIQGAYLMLDLNEEFKSAWQLEGYIRKF